MSRRGIHYGAINDHCDVRRRKRTKSRPNKIYKSLDVSQRQFLQSLPSIMDIVGGPNFIKLNHQFYRSSCVAPDQF